MLNNLYYPELKKNIKKFARICFPCSLNNIPIRQEKYGLYPINNDSFSVIHQDLIEIRSRSNSSDKSQYKNIMRRR
jgi:hypothetical protein